MTSIPYLTDYCHGKDDFIHSRFRRRPDGYMIAPTSGPGFSRRVQSIGGLNRGEIRMSEQPDWLFLAPDSGEVDAALAQAVKAVNGRRRSHRLPWPPSDQGDYQWARDNLAEGWWQWDGHAETRRPDASEVVWTAWWTDALGRKHHRVVGQRAVPMEVGYYPLFSPLASGRPPLALVHPGRVVVRTRGEVCDVLGACTCGMVGMPESLGWMGTSCGPCHDRHAEGHAVPDESSTPACQGVEFSADRSLVALLGEDSQTITLRSTVGQEPRTLRARYPIEKIVLSPAGDLLAGALTILGSVRSILLWDLPSGEEREPFSDGVQAGCDALAFARDGKTLAVARHHQDVRLLDVESRQLRHVLPGYFGDRQGIAFSSDGHFIATATEGHTARIWDVATGTSRRRIPTQHYVPGLAISPDGRLLAEWAAANADRDLVLWDLSTGKEWARIAGEVGGRGATFSPDGRWLVWPNRYTTFRFIDTTTGAERCRLEWPARPPLAVEFTADSRGLLVVSSCGTALDVWPLDVLGQEE
jgi:hypothetical protein